MKHETKSLARDEEQPLVTFALFAYNQDKFIREAVEGAFSQTYSPLEIILSDDCSQDKTFDIIKEMVDNYKGPHKLVLNRNEKNLGLVEHVNKIFEKCSGELVVLAAGDDVSVPERVATLVDHWGTEPNISAISSGFININSEGEVIDKSIGRKNRQEVTVIKGSRETLTMHILEEKYSIAGCTEAVVPKNFTSFRQIPAGTISEDRVFTFRSLLVNGIMFIPDRLVMYRAHENNIFNNRHGLDNILRSAIEKEKRTQFFKKNKYDVLKVYLVELAKAREANILDLNIYKYLRGLLEKRSYVLEKQSVWWELRFYQKILPLLRMTLGGYSDDLKWAIVRLIPYRVFISLKQSKIDKRHFAANSD